MVSVAYPFLGQQLIQNAMIVPLAVTIIVSGQHRFCGIGGWRVNSLGSGLIFSKS